MKRQDLQNIFSLPQLRNRHELIVLENYNNYIMQQIDEMKLHTFHKEEVKSVLLQAITEAKVSQQNQQITPKNQNWFFRILQKTAR